MNKIPLLEKFAAQSLVYVDTGMDDGKELIFSKEKFAELILTDVIDILSGYRGKVIWKNEEEMHQNPIYVIQKHFGVKND